MMSNLKVLLVFVFAFVGVANAARTAAPAICEDTLTRNLAAVDTGICPSGTKEWRGAGANLFDVFWVASSGQYNGRNGMGFHDSLAAIESAKANGIRVFRAFASDWEQNNIYWKQHPDQFWSEFDQVVEAIELSGLSWIPSIGYDGWHKIANALTPGLNETMNDLVINASSVSRQLIASYFEEITQRYTNRSSILMWELGNELNLLVNLPPPTCGSEQCFNTAQMVEFAQFLVDIIRKVDTVRPISSGFSLPRQTAYHQEHCPHGKSGIIPTCKDFPSGYWGIDTVEQFKENFAQQNSALGVWSIHHYSNPTDCYFDPKNCVNNASGLLSVCSDAAKEHNAALYVGEYGGAHPNFTGPTAADQAFPKAVLEAQVEDEKRDGAMILSTIWAWECPCQREKMVCIWPNSTLKNESGSSTMISIIQQTNDLLNHDEL